MENWLLGHWYTSDRPPWYLRFLEPLYHLGFKRAQKSAARDKRRYRAPVPVVVVGNLTAGGAGKTPLVIRLSQLATNMGLKPGIASTGYGRKGQQTLHVKAGDDAGLCGDEPVLLARRTGAPVVVSANRVEAVRELVGMGVDLVLSDDGLQHAALERDIELCVVDGERGFGNGHLIPAGPLREPVARLATVDYVFANGDWPGATDGVEFNTMQMDVYVVHSLDEEKMYPVEEFASMCKTVTVHAVAGIGNPGRFQRLLESQGFAAEMQVFPDHHAFTKGDFTSIKPGAAIIMTEKDAVKCRSFDLENAWYIPVEARLPEAFEKSFTARLAALTGNET
ncbi:MAG: tetraacyldisaccharide 4'-kinase [Xanthomonadales bacterium]|nr:tetraacyldisaccharide 4'-kinase [Xanthomonadales bacterium]